MHMNGSFGEVVIALWAIPGERSSCVEPVVGKPGSHCDATLPLLACSLSDAGWLLWSRCGRVVEHLQLGDRHAVAPGPHVPLPGRIAERELAPRAVEGAGEERIGELPDPDTSRPRRPRRPASRARASTGGMPWPSLTITTKSRSAAGNDASVLQTCRGMSMPTRKSSPNANSTAFSPDGKRQVGRQDLTGRSRRRAESTALPSKHGAITKRASGTGNPAAAAVAA